MKILQINNYHYPKGGADIIYLKTSRLLKEKGHQVINFSVKEPETIDNKYNQYFIKAPKERFDTTLLQKIMSIPGFIYSFQARKKLEQLIIAEKPNIAHLHIFFGRLTNSILPVLKKHKIPIIMTVHEYRMLCPTYLLKNKNNSSCEKCANGNYLHCIYNKCNKDNLAYSIIMALECFIRDKFFSYQKYIDKFIFPSEFTLNKHLKYQGKYKKKFYKIYNFIDINKTVSTQNIKKENYYLYFGRLSEEKGIMTLLRTWKNFPNLNLKIVGSGVLKNDIVGYIEKNNLNNITLAGYLEGNKLKKTIQTAKYIIAPSECFETFGLSVAEGMILGTPVIAAKIGAYTELITHQKNGFLFTPRDINSLQKVITEAENLDDDSYKKMIKNGIDFAKKNFNEDIYYSELIKVYNQSINDSGYFSAFQPKQKKYLFDIFFLAYLIYYQHFYKLLN